MGFQRAFSLLAVLALLLFALPGRGQSYHIYIDTTPLQGVQGNVDVQFNPGGADALPANALVQGAFTDGAFLNTVTLTGAASGRLPGPPNVSLDNLNPLNDLFQGIQFGSRIELDLCFSGIALDPGFPSPISGTTFSISLYDASGATPLLTSSPDGSLFHIDIAPDGSLSDVAFADNAGVVHTALIPMAECVPEPGALLLGSASGIAALLFAQMQGTLFLATRRSAGPSSRT